jgi:N-acetyl-gamma-glutamyl-phosphate reductase
MHRVAILGASGYTGLELTRLVARHGQLELVALGSDRWVGDTALQRAGVSGPHYASMVAATNADADLVFLATPAEVSHGLVPRVVARGGRVVDLSGAFRLRDAAHYPTYYKIDHAHAPLLAEAVYGLPELGARDAIRTARVVANPGCYATAIALAIKPVAPLVTGRVIADAASGVTGAGRKATEEMSFAEVADDMRAYRVLRHQHVPEIEQTVGLRVTFVPHLLPIRRGILATCHAQLAEGMTAAGVAAAFARAYGDEPFIELAAVDDVRIAAIAGTNRCRIGYAIGDAGELVVLSALDNLVKGAAGQALQNANLMLGLDETRGLQ